MVISKFPSTTVIGDEHAGKPLLEFLCAKFPQIGKDVWVDRFRRGLVLVDGSPATPGRAFSSGTGVQYFREVETEPDVPLDYSILFQDDHIIVTDKPSGLPTTPSGDHINNNLYTILRVDLGLDYLTPVHRLDKDTSGLVLWAKTRESASALVEQVRNQEIDRTYNALVGSWEQEVPLTIEEPLLRDLKGGNPLLTRVHPDGKPSRTDVMGAKEAPGGRWELVIAPLTGRQHQIRVHLQHIGHPVLGDRLYGNAPGRELALNCRKIKFKHPTTGEMLEFISSRVLAV